MAADSFGDPRDQRAHCPIRDGSLHAGQRSGTHRSFPGVPHYSSKPTWRPRGATDGGFARNRLLARRMIERGVSLCAAHAPGLDQHGDLPKQIRGQRRDVDQLSAALVEDLHQRGLLDTTLVIWGREFGRSVYSQGTGNQGQLRPGSPRPVLYDLDGRWRVKPASLRRHRRLLHNIVE